MKHRDFIKHFVMAILMGFLIMPPIAISKEAIQEWELINPEGALSIKAVELASRLNTLEGKTVVLRWNGKPGGDHFLNRVAELLTEKVKDVKIIKAWEVIPQTTTYDPQRSVAFAKKLMELKPDIIIGAQAD